MKVNVCVNGMFRYRNYIRYYDDTGTLGKFYCAHKVTTNAESLGLDPKKFSNIWAKEYLLHAGLKLSSGYNEDRVYIAICDLWQRAVIANWEDCDVVEAVTGGIADRVLRFAKERGVKTIGHPVNSHPVKYAGLVNQEAERLGIKNGIIPTENTKRKVDELDLCDYLIVDSTFVKKSFVENGYPEERIETIVGAASPAFFKARTLEESTPNKFRVLCVGAISPRKGQRYLLEAWRRLALPNAELILVGAISPASKAVVQGFEGTFTHYPSVPNKELRRLMVTASVFVLPSIEDGFAQAALEAMSVGLPTVVTHNMGIADLIRSGENGLIIPPFSSSHIASIIETLYNQPELAIQIGRSGAASVGNLMSWQVYAQNALDQIRKVALNP